MAIVKYTWSLFLAFAIVCFSVSLSSAANGAKTTDFVWTPTSEFQWWVNPQTKKMNFRECNYVNRQRQCYGPMLLNGIDVKLVPALLSFYRERLDQSGNHQMKQLVRALSGSIGTVAAYTGMLSSISIFRKVVPPNLVEKMSRLPIRFGFHVISLGALSILLYSAIDSYVHLRRQKVVYRIYCAAIGSNPQEPPEIALQSQALFNEFITTFRRALQDFTHGGGTFDENGYLIF